MGNLVDKTKLLSFLSDYQASSKDLLLALESGELDFHPKPRITPASALNTIDPALNTLDIAQIRPVCFGVATGKACPEVATCKFILRLEKLPCPLILNTLSFRAVSITDGSETIWDYSGVKR